MRLRLPEGRTAWDHENWLVPSFFFSLEVGLLRNGCPGMYFVLDVARQFVGAVIVPTMGARTLFVAVQRMKASSCFLYSGDGATGVMFFLASTMGWTERDEGSDGVTVGFTNL